MCASQEAGAEIRFVKGIFIVHCDIGFCTFGVYMPACLHVLMIIAIF